MAEYNYTPDFMSLYEIVAKHDLIAIAYVADDEYDSEVNALVEILNTKENFTKTEIEQQIRSVFTTLFSENIVKNIPTHKIPAFAEEVFEWSEKRNKLNKINI